MVDDPSIVGPVICSAAHDGTVCYAYFYAGGRVAELAAVGDMGKDGVYDGKGSYTLTAAYGGDIAGS